MSDLPTPESQRAIDLTIEVAGTPEEVWQAIATGPGISSWYVPHTVEEREGGAMSASFGPGPEMQVTGRVAAWDPPHRVVFDGGEDSGGLAFEWLVEARDGGSCVVRLVSTGFGEGAEWDDQYDEMTEGWKLFLLNLQLHLAHFRGETATAVMPTSMWAGPPDDAWARLTTGLGVPARPAAGNSIATTASGAPLLAGQVVDVGPLRMALLVDRPARGTAFLAVEGHGETVAVSVWSWLYGAEGAAAAKRDASAWQAWLDQYAVPKAESPG
jgi:uncharacterized protein YndB with AHSA1/START domain